MIAYFENGDVQAALTYRDVGLEEFGLSEITSDRFSVRGGLFTPEKILTVPFAIEAQGRRYSGGLTGDFTGEGAFGGTDAAGVVGYIDGEIAVEYGQVLTNLGTFRSVFYGNRDEY